MKWSIFERLKRPGRGQPDDRLAELVGIIERSAPREHSKERASHYYHYGAIRAYGAPLMELLEWVVQHSIKGPPEPRILKACFSVLKDFYDIKDRLSPGEALNDPNFMRKLGHMLWIFYGVGMSPRELREGLKGLEEDDG